MRVIEPMTFLTDYVLGAVSLWLSVRLFAHGRREGQRAVTFWATGFAMLGIAALTGGAYHGLPLVLGQTAAKILWKATVYSIGLASLLFFTSAVMATVTKPLRRWLLYLAAAKLLVYGTWMSFHDAFAYVIYEYSPTLVVILALQVYAGFKRKAASAPWVVAGVLLSFAGAAIQMSGLAPHRHFNHNDLYHVIQIVAMIALYKGGRLLRDL